MRFEDLANELLLDIFEFLDIIRLFRAFCNLNSRFNNLLCTSIRIYHVDFRSLSKQEINYFCQRYLPSMINDVHSLCLSDDDETPNLSEIFLSYGLNLDQWIHLQSLSLYSINSIKIVNQIISQCRNISQLKMVNCCVDKNITYSYFMGMTRIQQGNVQLINNIWSLPKLINCKLNNSFGQNISVVSSSIEYLDMENINCSLGDLSCLFQCTLHLRRLYTTIKATREMEQIHYSASSLISLNILFDDSTNLMKKMFQQTKNLRYLTIETSSTYLNGYEWEQILVEYLSQLKVFRLKMDMKFSYSIDSEGNMYQLLDTFRTSYWLEEHQWFVRCDWQSYNKYSYGVLYTVPYAFKTFLHLSYRYSKSTCPNNRDYSSFNKVQNLRYINGKNSLFDNSVVFSYQILYLRSLQMNFPFNVNFWSSIPTLYYLISLHATLRHNSAYSQLQLLLDRAPHLYSLKLCVLPEVQRYTLFQIKNKSIRRLEFIEECTVSEHYFNTTECSALIKSSLGRQCEVLQIVVEKEANVLDLIIGMNNLRILNFRCKKTSTWTKDEIIQRIKSSKSPLISSLTRHPNQKYQHSYIGSDNTEQIYTFW